MPSEFLDLGRTGFFVVVNSFYYFIYPTFLRSIYLFMRDTERERERGRNISRGRSRLPTGGPVWDSIPDPGITP